MVPPDPAAGGIVPSPGLDPDSEQWIQSLASIGAPRDAGLARLHELLLRIARSELHRRGDQLQIAGPELDDLAYQATADALVAIVSKLGDFRGESRFTTWAYKFVVLPAREAEHKDLADAVRHAVDEHLTARQRQIFVALVLNGVPLDALAIELGSTRNAIYKTMFDARRKLRAALAAHGYLDQETSRPS
jgi:RNA polymerase sigma-70 factor (ECF subfamily)